MPDSKLSFASSSLSEARGDAPPTCALELWLRPPAAKAAQRQCDAQMSAQHKAWPCPCLRVWGAGRCAANLHGVQTTRVSGKPTRTVT